MDAPEIIKLPDAVINKIAAGEVVQRPCHAVKELLENALDAGATTITVTAKQPAALSVADNGQGIRFADMPRLCERFTTSKLRRYEDLKAIGTFGFRGEALASMSYVARVRVVSRRRGAARGQSASYTDGAMQQVAPELVATAPEGTAVHVEDLFYNLPVRRAALRSHTTEYNHIADCVRKYALRYPHCVFVCRRDPQAPADVLTAVGDTAAVIAGVFGGDVGRNLLTFACSSADRGPDGGLGGCAAAERTAADEPDEKEEASAAPPPDAGEPHTAGSFTVRGWITGVDYSNRRPTAAYFVNGRLVDNAAVHRAAVQAYSSFLARGRHPFLCMFVDVPPDEVDVNVHPTKAEVALLAEEAVAAAVHAAVTQQLGRVVNESRTFAVVAPAAPTPQTPRHDLQAPAHGHDRGMIVDAEIMRHENIDLQIRQNTSVAHAAGAAEPSAKRAKVSHGDARDGADGPAACPREACTRILRAQADPRLREVFAAARLVGMVSGDRAAVVESGSDIYLLDLPLAVREAAVQTLLRPRDARAPATLLTFAHPPRLRDLCRVALGIPGVWCEADGPQADIETALERCIVKHRAVLGELGVGVAADGRLESLPRVWAGIAPALGLLPLVVLRIGSEVKWGLGPRHEHVHTAIARELSALFAYRTDAAADPLFATVGLPMREFVPRVLLPFLQSPHFHPPPHFATSQTLVKIATTPQLLATFDRAACAPGA